MFGFGKRQRPARRETRGFLARLARDTAGNTLILVAAAMFPMIGMVGSGIDMGRAYMAQARLQLACDAAALAGRRAMTNGTVDDTVRAEANKFFQFNFPIGTQDVLNSAAFGAKGFTPAVSGAANATVVVTAATTMPTTLMAIFGKASIPISANCNAKLDFVNTDIVLVLDTTGSMADKAVSTDTDAKIVAMRKAVLSLYDTLAPIQTQLENAGLRLRFSVVPYASSINMGKLLRGVSANYVAGSWTYQSRQARYQHTKTGDTTAQCAARADPTVPGGAAVTSNRQGQGTSSNPYSYTCTWTDHVATGNNAAFYGWTYMPMPYDVATYGTGTSTPTSSTASTAVQVPSRTPGTSVSATWAGCIEERKTVNTLTGTSTSIPTDAKDLDIDLIPTSDIDTKWKPYWPDVEYKQQYDYLDRSNLSAAQQYLLVDDTFNRPQVACPAQGKRLQAWTRDALSTYLNTLNPDGGTYHDNGMIWGIRMLSGAGVFSTDNPANYGGMPISRYIIFMTDGALDTGYESLYTTYGIEKYDKRVTLGGDDSSETDQYNRHLTRFNLLCTVAKNRGISVWVVAFAQALTTSLSNCATNSAQASTSTNQTALNARFVQIGQNIGALRLTQ